MWIRLPQGTLVNSDHVRCVHLLIEEHGKLRQPIKWSVTCETGDRQWNRTFFATEDEAKTFQQQLSQKLGATELRDRLETKQATK